MADDEKLAKFGEFDWGGDGKWNAYLKNIELPGADQITALLKLKAKWYKRNVDPDFEVEWLSGQKAAPSSSGPTPSSATPPPPAPSQTSNANTAQQPAGGSWWSRFTAGTGGNSAAAQALQERTLFMLHIAMLVTAVGHVGTILLPGLSYRFFRWFMMLTILAQGIKVFGKHGWPPVTRWTALQGWLQQVLPSNAFFHLVCAMVFGTGRGQPVTLAVVPPVVVALYRAFSEASKRYSSHSLWVKYGAQAHQWLLTRQRQALVTSAYTEVATGAMLIIQLFSPARNFLLAFFYWNMLKMRYQAPEPSPYHREVWRLIDQRTIGIRTQFPILERLVGYARGWFLSVR
mmetsp:Transcript_5504/g.12192  ORF Transcript_5504/g.12192 Transcript_5504/m.12192 type:complete len:345 (+) Transcript_5504:99-1133(+)|eukprot:CAMPEP_0202891108 /NCGR_PEP_ID=MMETSP1392-20130828/1272_1 /ASSEMBLY_ACC=CAM_ASM_000868 /TAXON_ID=225041 /ORGANISM="Chlamydomonas chlamydogama, Strain SAG 11-48b" /LENGTH=344 /DNA_ID=CAMNT_0049574785 /DNA_START=71 /DNA_END=1105 /DNA_ORIENTATION=+